jgi:hypothetical protein
MLFAAFQVHEGESLYLANKWDLIALGIFTIFLMLLIFSDRVPSIGVIREFVEIINTRGGNILLLAFFVWIFFRSAMLFIYHVMAMAQAPGDMVDKAQAVVTSGLGFVTGSAFGGAFGALLKTMNPSTTETPPSIPPGVTQAKTTTETVSTIPGPPIPPKP